MYVAGYPARLGENLATLLVFDATVANARPVIVDRLGKWWLVASPHDWLVGAGHSVEHLFSHLIPTPQVAANTCRHEVMVAALAEGVVVINRGKLDWQFGDVGDYSSLQRYASSKADGWRIVAFAVANRGAEPSSTSVG